MSKQQYNRKDITIKIHGECFICTSHCRTHSDYPQLWRNGKRQRMNRYIWEYFNGSIPEGMCVLHKCDNPACINIKHLFLGTHQDNVDDKIRKGRMKRGADRPQAKLTEGHVRRIRLDLKNGMSNRDTAWKYNVSRSTISDIRVGKTWRHVTY